MAEAAIKIKKSKTKTKLTKVSQTLTTGRRKTAIARVFMREGKGSITVNGKSLDKYFARETSRMMVRQPLEVMNLADKFDIKATVCGGGNTGQAGAIRLGIARALVQYDEQGHPEAGVTLIAGSEIAPGTKAPLTTRKVLRKAKLLTRDPRVVERKKVGHHKARKSLQFSKR